MSLSIANSLTLDPFTAWQIANGARWCQRLSATITQAQCELNYTTVRTFGNEGGCQCVKSCGGLQNQNRSDEHIKTAYTDENKPVEGFDALDEIIDGLYEEPALNDDFDDVELDLDDEQLLALFPELVRGSDKEAEQELQQAMEYQTAMPRYAVYHGRCKRCGGYVENYREWQDDNVFRCLACGHRTGEEYERNRELQNKGVIL